MRSAICIADVCRVQERGDVNLMANLPGVKGNRILPFNSMRLVVEPANTDHGACSRVDFVRAAPDFYQHEAFSNVSLFDGEGRVYAQVRLLFKATRAAHRDRPEGRQHSYAFVRWYIEVNRRNATTLKVLKWETQPESRRDVVKMVQRYDVVPVKSICKLEHLPRVPTLPGKRFYVNRFAWLTDR